MTLDNLLDTVISSELGDWHKIICCWGARTGPSYKDHLQFHNVYAGQSNILYSESHGTVAVFSPDVCISLAFGLTQLENFQEKWANQFPDPSASSSFVDLFYNNALVFRHQYVTVDGGRAYLPIPKTRTELEVSKNEYQFVRLVHSILHEDKGKAFDEYFQRGGFKIAPGEWPKL